MNWDDIQHYWPDLKRKLAKDHPDLDTDALERTPEGRTRLLQLIDAKYGAARPLADDELDDLMAGRRTGTDK